MTLNRIDQIQFLRGTAAAIAAENPIPYAGEPVFETDTGVLKIGDNTTAYNSLSAVNGTPTTITVANEASDATCFPLFATAATGNLGPKTNSGLTFNSATGLLTATGFSGPLTGNVTGNASGSAGSVAVGGITGLGTGVATALAVNVGSAGAPVVNGGALGTPSSGTLTSCTGLPAAGVVGTAAILGANTFTGLQTMAAAGISLSSSVVANDVANIVSIRNSTTAQTLHVYGTASGSPGSDYVRASLSCSASAVTLAGQTAGAGADDIPINITPAGVSGTQLTNYLQMTEQTAPSAGATNTVRIYAEDNGAGKTRLMALFNTGAAQQLAIEP